MKFITFYFSGTGNTKWVCENFDKLLKENNQQSSTYSIEDTNIDKDMLKQLNDIDYIGFAYPIYLQSMPRIMRNFISNLSDLIIKQNIEIKYAFFLNTYAYTNAYGVFRANCYLKKTDIKTVGYVNLKLSDNTKSNVNINPNTGDTMTTSIKERAISKMTTFINKLENNKNYINGVNPSIIIGRIISKAFEKVLVNNYKNMKVDMSKCIKCMDCVQNCPTKCIQFKDNSFIFSSACEACMRCKYNCKACAISNKTMK